MQVGVHRKTHECVGHTLIMELVRSAKLMAMLGEVNRPLGWIMEWHRFPTIQGMVYFSGIS
jgi:hypothetical protein